MNLKKSKYCCAECFKDEYIKKFVKEKGFEGTCDVCGRSEVSVADFELVAEFIIYGFRKAYDIVENEAFWHPEEKRYADPVTGKDSGKSIFDILYYDESIFSDELSEPKAKEFLQRLMDSIKPNFREMIRGDNDLYSDIETPNWMLKDELYYSDKAKDKKKKLYNSWDEFKKVTKYRYRFFDMDKDKKREKLLEKLKIIFSKLRINLLKGERLFRARIYNDSLESLKKPDDIGPAPVEKTKNNRFSPTGISYMYLSGDEETCIKEINPQFLDKVIVGEFELKRNIEILDLTGNPIKSIFCENYDHDTRMLMNYFVYKFSEEISKPMKPDDNTDIEYVPTQVLSEYIRKLGYKGIKYESSLNRGHYNYVLFFGPKNSEIECFENYLCLKYLYNCVIKSISHDYELVQVVSEK
ncbi:RES domain-containing protein [Thermosipho ferrireducens]|uniref:RES domain-containing protein n=1 Tax=Thermosipho ferrireducens TaxID=2571116 RepID=A0ABX7S7D6_9BACT|nr:RES domain-containing protein [Thermosipho ferrireducens]QTA38514.1 RES domain-containing protein [Thermosipho ferrireducens]